MSLLSSFLGSSSSSGGDKRTYKNYQEFTSPGSSTFTVPAGVTKVRAIVIGAGGGGGHSPGAGSGGAGGGFAMGEYTVTPGQNISVTVGSGGSYGTAGSSGSSSSFGSFCSATGGGGGDGFS